MKKLAILSIVLLHLLLQKARKHRLFTTLRHWTTSLSEKTTWVEHLVRTCLSVKLMYTSNAVCGE